MILSTLLITVPPMAGNFFSQAVGSFTPISAFGGNGQFAGAQGAGGQASGYGGGSYGGMPAVSGAKDATQGSMPAINHGSRVTNPAASAQTDVIKTNPMMGNAQATPNSNLAAPTTTGSYHNASVASQGIGSDSTAVNQRHNALLSTPQKAGA